MVKGKLVLTGTIELLSPALIGCGRNERTDSDLLMDSAGKPFIPATSFVGILKHFIKVNDSEKELKRFWGFTTEKTGQQSALCCSDLYCLESEPKTGIRDGIKIDNKTGIVKYDPIKKSGAKYDYEVVEKGTKFYLKLEVICLVDNTTFNRRMIATIRKIIEEGQIQIGAKTNSGLGKMKLTNAHVYEFDFSKKEDVVKWLKKDFSIPNPFSEKPFDIPNKTFFINAIFSLKSSFISRSYSEKPGDPDAVSIKSGSDFVMTGTSLKGAIRSRAERILNTLEKPPNILTELFGTANEDSKEKIKGRIRIDEVILPGFIAELQSRIKIDRFTGGTIESALFDTMPLFSGNMPQKVQNVSLTIRDYKPYEAGLILLVLKDLWTGDLAVGGEKNVWRGVFEGLHSDIFCEDKHIILKRGLEGLSEENKTELEEFVSALRNYTGKEHDNGK